MVSAIGALACGTLLGLGATAWVVQHRFDPAAARRGPWVFWPKVGTADIDPYARAILSQTGEVPVAAAEGMLLLAGEDSSGRPLHGRCDYRVTGRTLPARLWSLSVVSPDGQTWPNPIGRYGFTSANLLRDGDGTFSVRLGPAARPGNWLPTPDAPFRIALHLYEATLVSVLGGPAQPLPSIERIECRR